MKLRHLVATLVCVLALSKSAVAQDADPPAGPHPGGHPAGGGGHFADGPGAWAPHPGWQGSMQHFDGPYWQTGHWWHGTYSGRPGWWWIVGPDWYWFPTAIYPYPDPHTPLGMTPGYWYWCDDYQQYYPYVGACPSGWRAMPLQ
jgi:hypothetical protein